MERIYTVSWKLLGSFLETVQKLSTQPDETHLVLPDPMDNFVVWRESALDLTNINPRQLIMKTPYKEKNYILFWDEKSEPTRR